MATLITQLKVNDYGAWRPVYDSLASLRSSYGEKSSQVYHDASDPNMVTIIFKWDSIANAQKYSQSTELKAALSKSGVQGPPSFQFLTEA
jgi:hypothetical protein